MEKQEPMKVLIVTYNYLTGYGGGAFGARAYINAFSALYEDVTLLYPIREGETGPDGLREEIRKIGVTDPAPRPAKLARIFFKGILHRFEKPFRDLLAREHFDLIVFQNSKCSSRIIRDARASGARIVVVHDNFEQEYTRDNTPVLLRPILLPATVRTEREAVRTADLNLVLTPDDARLFESKYGGNISLWGTFEYGPSQPRASVAVCEPVFAITGNLGARQTVSSLLPWLSDYYPILKEMVPDARLLVAGKEASTALQQRLSEVGAEFVDTPADMSAVLARARYYLCPVDCGGGVKLRVMDGLREGLPALVHRVSARGYEAFEGLSLFVYDDPASFRKALSGLLSCDSDPVRCRELYDRIFSFEAGVERLRKLMQA